MSTLSTNQNPVDHPELFDFTNGIEFDKKIAPQEIRVQLAWLRQLYAAGKINDSEYNNIGYALEKAGQLIQQNQFPWQISEEDIHMNLERFVTQEVGECGKKMHIGRSRNDLIATTLRLYVNDQLEISKKLIIDLQTTILLLAKKNLSIALPGMTHLQNGQPILLSQILCSYAWTWQDQKELICFSQQLCLKNLPLGAAAFSGSHLALNYQAIAEELGFQKVCQNSYHSVGGRDFLIHAIQHYALVATHLTRIAFDFIYWSSSNIDFVSLPKNWSTGSSIMPNKRNPDVLEIIRGRCAQVISAGQEACSIAKSIGTSYGTELHVLKFTYDRANEMLQSCLYFLNCFLKEVEFKPEVARTLLAKGFILATEIANKLVDQGWSFREAYAKTAELVSLSQGNEEEFFALIEKQNLNIGQIDLKSFLTTRENPGGTGPESVKEQIRQIESLLASTH